MSEVRTRTRVCDACNADLTEARSLYEWHYILAGEFTPSVSNIGYDPHPVPPEDRHFCNRDCLSQWIVAEEKLEAERKAASEARIRERKAKFGY